MYARRYHLSFESQEHGDASFKEYVKNSKYIERMNDKKEHNFVLGETKFTHLSNDRYRQIASGSVKSSIQDNEKIILDVTTAAYTSAPYIPLSYDWTNTPAVTPVKDQGFCGACWAFSTAAAMEAALYLKYGEQKQLSEEQLVSCNLRELGCGGGNPRNIYSWVAANGGLTTSYQFPYISGTIGKASNAHCDVALINRDSRLSTVKLGRVKPFSAAALRAAIATQPVVVFLDGSSMLFQNYRGGIINSPDCGNDLSHAMLAVGYGTRNGVDYIKIKNSYGTNWGEEGYVLISSDESANYCGVLTDASFPVL